MQSQPLFHNSALPCKDPDSFPAEALPSRPSHPPSNSAQSKLRKNSLLAVSFGPPNYCSKVWRFHVAMGLFQAMPYLRCQ